MWELEGREYEEPNARELHVIKNARLSGVQIATRVLINGSKDNRIDAGQQA